MSSQALLDAIETSGKGELAQLEQETRHRVKEILAEAEKKAQSCRETAYQEALRPVSTERARRLHEAQMAALKVRAAIRDHAVEKLVAQIEDRFRTVRDQPQYQNILRDLIEEAVEMLGEKEMANNTPVPTKLPRLEVDGRDEKLAQDILESLAFKMEIAPELVCWGGVVVRSGDGRIIVANTLEARFERLKPHLGMFMPSFKLIG